MQKLDLTHAREMELYSYQIALLTMVNNCNSELARVKAKLETLKKEEKQWVK